MYKPIFRRVAIAAVAGPVAQIAFIIPGEIAKIVFIVSAIVAVTSGFSAIRLMRKDINRI